LLASERKHESGGGAAREEELGLPARVAEGLYGVGGAVATVPSDTGEYVACSDARPYQGRRRQEGEALGFDGLQ
jgi:hypothetical protein